MIFERGRHDDESACIGKQPFDSAAAAMRAVKHMNRQRTKVKAYRCQQCGKHHLSSVAGRQKR